MGLSFHAMSSLKLSPKFPPFRSGPLMYKCMRSGPLGKGILGHSKLNIYAFHPIHPAYVSVIADVLTLGPGFLLAMVTFKSLEQAYCLLFSILRRF